MTFGIMTIGTTTLGTMTHGTILGTMTLGTATFGTMTFSTMTLGIMTLGIMTLGTMTLGIKTLNKNQKMCFKNVKSHSAECHILSVIVLRVMLCVVIQSVNLLAVTAPFCSNIFVTCDQV
jgi:hypothetical protein